MSSNCAVILVLSLLLPINWGLPKTCFASSGPGVQESTQTAIAKSIGVIKTINGNAITLAPTSGPEVAVTVQPNARILRLAPGDKDLKNATPVQLQDLQVGDTIRARGLSSNGANSIAALEIIVITRAAVQAVTDQIRQDWQKRGLGGLVSAVDPATATITISVAGFAGNRTIAVHASKNTVFRRYAPDSVKFEEARPSTLEEIHPGDQMRARGNRSADGAEFAAEEIVTGSFRNIAGTVNSVDANAGTLAVQDVFSKRTVVVKITADSQLHKLPPEIAQRFAMRLKAMMPGAGGNPSARTETPAGNAPVTAAAAPGGATPVNGAGSNVGATGMGGGTRGSGAPDVQQMLNRMPAVTLSDLHKGDAVMMVATRGAASSPSTAITLLSGVEPILEAAPTASQAMMLAPWNLGGAPNGDTNP